MKRNIIFLLSTFCMLFVCVGCLDDDTTVVSQEMYPLTSFTVKVNDTYYHGKIDQTTHKVQIGAITNPQNITGVDFQLMNATTTIAPDPASFIGQWKKEQQVTVTTSDNQKTTYTIIFTKFDESMKNVIFFDDFDVNGHPSTDRWVLCRKQSSDWNDEMSESYDQAYVENGNLILKAEKVGDVYKAGGVETQGKFDFTFGRVDVRARITQCPNGAFPAIWMMPKNYIYQGWPACGEIDIMEHIKQEPYIHSSIHNHYYDALHIDNPSHTGRANCNIAEYNIYSVEWTADKLDFYLNGELTFTYPNLRLEDEAEKMQWPFTADSKFYLILNMGLGGDREGSWPGPIDDANLPAVMEVDWVKVTKLDVE